jgi:N-acetylneuraminate synthase/N,N'-diacetyllegionaminate synthase
MTGTSETARFKDRFEIDGRALGSGCPVYIIAEAGVAHFGDEEKAYRLVDLAADAKADAIKFQTFNVDAMISSELADWKERLGSRQLPYEAFARIQSYCRKRGITFFSTAHDEPSLDFLTSLDVPVYKIGSGEVGNLPYLRKIARLGKPMIISTGMYRHEQIAETLDAVAGEGAREVALLHCVTRYPTPPSEAAIGTITAFRERYDAVIGYSDHTRGFHIPLASVALGARVIEKHITLDFDIPNAQDWKVSCGPDDLGRFVSEVRDIEQALGVKAAAPSGEEEASLMWASKSLVAARDLRSGDVLRAEDLTAKRPGSGIPPSKSGEVIGRTLAHDRPVDSVIKWEHLV